jgi:hypothetical protein
MNIYKIIWRNKKEEEELKKQQKKKLDKLRRRPEE